MEMDISEYLVREQSGSGYTKQNVIHFALHGLCITPSLYGSAPPVSTRITAGLPVGSQLPSSCLSISRVSA